MHEVAHPEKRLPAERPPRVKRRIVVRAEPAEIQERHGQRITHGERRRRAGGRREIHGARFLRDTDIQDHIRLSSER